MLDDRAATIELDRLLSDALALADRLECTLVAIHVDEARNLLRTGSRIGAVVASLNLQ
jgi:hypothetical protein